MVLDVDATDFTMHTPSIHHQPHAPAQFHCSVQQQLPGPLDGPLQQLRRIPPDAAPVLGRHRCWPAVDGWLHRVILLLQSGGVLVGDVFAVKEIVLFLVPSVSPQQRAPFI